MQKELTIMESHPTNDRTDFYIYHAQLELFPELRDFLMTFDIRSDDVTTKTHTPCLAILVQFMKEWREKHEDKLPSGFKEQSEFKDELRAEFGDDENVDDAVHWAYQCYNEPRIDRDVQQVLDDPAAATVTAESSDFWILVRALKDFMEKVCVWLYFAVVFVVCMYVIEWRLFTSIYEYTRYHCG